MKKVMLIYPPGEIYQRGEDRCQINVEASAANALRACNDLGYAAAILKTADCEIFLKDYPAEKQNLHNLISDVNSFKPDIVLISTTNGSINNDISIVNEIKKFNSDIKFILKGALFFNSDNDFINNLDLTSIEYLIGGEIEFIISPLIKAIELKEKNSEEWVNTIKDIQGLWYKGNSSIWEYNPVTHFNENLDEIPFPDRSIMHNELYINPLTNKPMATISTSRGCPSSCIYCLSPLISGKKVRYRSPESVFKELKECVEKYNINNFFFKSDTFTINKQWVISLCDLIINSDLKNIINWTANSRTDTIDEEIITKMKEAGCSIIALGIESGSNNSLKNMKKGTTVEQNKNAVNLIKKHKLLIYGFYIIGFPWETEKDINETKSLIYELNTDFIELSIATPFKGSELYNIVYKNTAGEENIIGKDSFRHLANGERVVSTEYLNYTRKEILLHYHLRPSYIFKKLFNKNITLPLLCNYFKYGFRMIKNLFI